MKKHSNDQNYRQQRKAKQQERRAMRQAPRGKAWEV
jgi:hypothetical protein